MIGREIAGGLRGKSATARRRLCVRFEKARQDGSKRRGVTPRAAPRTPGRLAGRADPPRGGEDKACSASGQHEGAPRDARGALVRRAPTTPGPLVLSDRGAPRAVEPRGFVVRPRQAVARRRGGRSRTRNRFALEDAPRYVFIAGGVGITPLRPMLAERNGPAVTGRRPTAVGPGRPWRSPGSWWTGTPSA